MFTEEAPGVYSVASRFVDGKNGIVVGERGTVAVDGSIMTMRGRRWRILFGGRGLNRID